jgi:uncharacterized protein YoxC
MELLLTLTKILALLCVSALCVYLVTVVKNLNIVLTNLERDLREISSKAAPVLENMEVITSKVRTIAENVDGEIEQMRTTVGAIRGMAESVIDFQQRVQHKIEEPVMDAVSFLSGVVKGVTTFLRVIRPRSNGGASSEEVNE